MRTTLNRAILAQTSFDSARPAGTAVSAHRFDTPGRYRVALVRGKAVTADVALEVTDDAPRPAKDHGCCGDDASPGAELDLTALPSGGGDVTLPAGGWLSLAGSRPPAEPHVVVTAHDRDDTAFDSRRLDGDDVFGLTLLRPGTYDLRNEATGASGRIVVAYPTPGKAPQRPPAPLAVTAHARGFSEETIELTAAQGLVFRFDVPSRIQIELERADDGPGGPKPRRPGTGRRVPRV